MKAVAIALKLTFSGLNQFVYVQTWFFVFVVVLCCILQIHYLNKVRKLLLFLDKYVYNIRVTF